MASNLFTAAYIAYMLTHQYIYPPSRELWPLPGTPTEVTSSGSLRPRPLLPWGAPLPGSPKPFGESLSLMQRMHPAKFPAILELHHDAGERGVGESALAFLNSLSGFGAPDLALDCGRTGDPPRGWRAPT